MIFALLEAGLLASSVSLDTFAAGFAYGSNQIKIPMLSVQIINGICSLSIGISFLIGGIVQPYLPHWLMVAVSFSVLFLVGLTKLMDSATKAIIRKSSHIQKEIKLSLFNFKLVLKLYADPEAADVDQSKSISPKEATLLALSLSLDGIAVGLGAALAGVNGLMLFAWSLVTNMAFLTGGNAIGKKAAQKIPFNISWLSGVVLIALAISRFF